MKELKIEIPDGYEVDKENSTFEKIVFKPIKESLPKTWEDLSTVGGWYSDSQSVLYGGYKVSPHKNNKNTFVTKEQAEASIALAQLSQLREVYRDGWIPDWCDENFKFCIRPYNNSFNIILVTHACYFLSFQNREIAEEFLENFYDLIEQARPLMS